MAARYVQQMLGAAMHQNKNLPGVMLWKTHLVFCASLWLLLKHERTSPNLRHTGGMLS